MSIAVDIKARVGFREGKTSMVRSRSRTAESSSDAETE
jgi:hypothetical protein